MGNSNHKVLLAEDDQDLGNVLKQYLEIEGFEVCHCLNGNEGLNAFKENTFDICILDIMMPKMDGFTLADEIKKINPKIPYLFLTAKSMKIDRLTGLKMGADDYITKPFEADELVLRIRNILNRSTKSTYNGCLNLGGYHLDFENLNLGHESGDQLLTLKEAELLRFLLQHQNQLVKTSQILKNLWGEDDYFMGRSMHVFISRLRKFLQYETKISIENIRGVGYILKLEE